MHLHFFPLHFLLRYYFPQKSPKHIQGNVSVMVYQVSIFWPNFPEMAKLLGSFMHIQMSCVRFQTSCQRLRVVKMTCHIISTTNAKPCHYSDMYPVMGVDAGMCIYLLAEASSELNLRFYINARTLTLLIQLINAVWISSCLGIYHG